MKFLIVGLGNMHPDYDGTRHNIGFDILDSLANKYAVSFKDDYLGDLAEIRVKGRTLILLKPSTYMNLSGKAVRYWLQKAKVHKDHLLVVVDDIHLDFGRIRLRPKGSDGGHNGLKSIQELIGDQDYARLRIGLGNTFGKGRQVDFVLGKWNDTEKTMLPQIIDKSCDCIEKFCTAGLSLAMTEFNQ
jgi:peptidyl-tRNA hydrolase, PTH1 family